LGWGFRYDFIDHRSEGVAIGFRVASIPERSTITLLLAGAIGMLAVPRGLGVFRGD
jgi:hypothetical protein